MSENITRVVYLNGVEAYHEDINPEFIKAQDATIRQQQLIIYDLTTTNNQLRNRVTELEYFKHKYDLVWKEPIRFCMFIWLRNVWPFSLFYRPDRGAK